MAVLAIRGGAAVREGPWLTWPVAGEGALPNLEQVLLSHRWSPTGVLTGEPSFDSKFRRLFAEYLGVKHCITTVNGSTALRIALEAADIGWGDEVIVPGLTWVANVEAVLSVGASPVLVDVDPRTLCISARTLEDAGSTRPRAAIVVHLNGAVADLGELGETARQRGMLIIEDAAQAHGSLWCGRRVGSIGAVGAFSMHNSKLLTCGEGGAVVTSSDELAYRAQQLCANGRVPSQTRVRVGSMEYVQLAELTGSNACLSEFQSAVLVDLLPQLDELNRACAEGAQQLEAYMSVLGFGIQESAPGSTRTYSNVVFRLPDELLSRTSVDLFAAAVEAECGIAVKRLYEPLNSSSLIRPESRPAWRWLQRNASGCEGLNRHLPVAEAAYASAVFIPHPYLRGSRADIDAIANSFEKVIDHVDELACGRPR